MNGEVGNGNDKKDVDDSVDTIGESEDTVVLSEDADDIDTVGDFTAELDVEKLVEKIESGEAEGEPKEKEVHRRLEELNEHFTRWVEDTYHLREHSTIGMRPLDRFGLDLGRIRHLHQCEFNQELFFLQATRKVRTDNTFQFENTRYEAPRDLRNQTITLRYNRFITSTAPEPPIAYFDNERLGPVILLNPVHNDRKPNLGSDNF